MKMKTHAIHNSRTQAFIFVWFLAFQLKKESEKYFLWIQNLKFLISYMKLWFTSIFSFHQGLRRQHGRAAGMRYFCFQGREDASEQLSFISYLFYQCWIGSTICGLAENEHGGIPGHRADECCYRADEYCYILFRMFYSHQLNLMNLMNRTGACMT